MIKKHLALLGLPAKDRVTGFEGVITSVSFDLYGCVQAVIQPKGVNEKGALKSGHWFDVSRIETTASVPVMDVPDYDEPREEAVKRAEKGPAEKPVR